MNWLERIIQRHRPKDGEASVYGVLLFTDAHPHTKKVIFDDDYWRALDEISGDKWAIFCTRAAQGSIGFPSFPSGIIGYMVPVWKEPSANKMLLSVFELKSTESLPVLVVFAKGINGEYLKNEIKIDESTQQSAFDSIKNAVKVVTSSLENIDDNNLKNSLGVHAAVSLAVQHAKNWQKLKEGIRVWQWLKSII